MSGDRWHGKATYDVVQTTFHVLREELEFIQNGAKVLKGDGQQWRRRWAVIVTHLALGVGGHDC